MEVKLKPLTLQDKAIFEEAYSKLKFPLAEHSFTWIHLWKDCYKDMEWANINSNLCLFITFEGVRHIWGPPLPGNKLDETLKACFDICKEYNQGGKQASVLYIPEEIKKNFENIKGYKLSEQNQDYIYKREDIIDLKGDKYKSQRNLRNRFLKNHDHKVESYDKVKHKDECEKLLKTWLDHKTQTSTEEHKGKLQFEYDANLRVLENEEGFDLKGIVVYANGEIKGYSFGEQSSESVCTDLFEKTDPKVKGLSQFIYGELLKQLSGEYVNAGEDWDVPYLQNTKNSYKPTALNKIYMLESCEP